MTVKQLALHQGFTPVTMPYPDKEIKNVYIGDLLSWVMGRAQEDDAWITIMSNINVVAVASLADVACVILAEDVILDEAIISTAAEKGINIISTPQSAYQVAKFLATVI